MDVQINHACIDQFLEIQESAPEKIWWAIILWGIANIPLSIDRRAAARDLRMSLELFDQNLHWLLDQGFLIEINPIPDSEKASMNRIDGLNVYAGLLKFKKSQFSAELNHGEEQTCTNGSKSTSQPSLSVVSLAEH